MKPNVKTGSETPNTFNGVRYLLENHRDLIDAKFALNEGGGGGGGGYIGADGERVFQAIQAGANVNCRIFPGHTQEEIRKTLEHMVGGEQSRAKLMFRRATILPATFFPTAFPPAGHSSWF